jgi:2-isopropylmalate synthase
MDLVRIFDTTLRDGEQSPGFSMNTAEKIRLARQLAALNVDVIEAGFPIASRGDLEAVKKVAQEVRTVPIAALARARKEDVTAAIEALKPAASPRLHIFLATSDLHLTVKLKMSREQALEAIGSMIRYGRQHVGEVEFSAEDAGRTDIDFLCQVCRVAVDAGATVLNLPDTVGYAVPEEYGAMFTRVREYLGDAQGITLSAHCHDDLGMAVANSLAAIRAGVRQIECTINGIGERAGNASLEEVVVALAVRKDSFGVTTGIRLEELFPTSRMLTEITGAQVAPNKAIVGANAFAHEAGIHQDGIIKNPLTYEIHRPRSDSTAFCGAGRGIVAGGLICLLARRLQLGERAILHLPAMPVWLAWILFVFGDHHEEDHCPAAGRRDRPGSDAGGGGDSAGIGAGI